jgi:hypothetical protein
MFEVLAFLIRLGQTKTERVLIHPHSVGLPLMLFGEHDPAI